MGVDKDTAVLVFFVSVAFLFAGVFFSGISGYIIDGEYVAELCSNDEGCSNNEVCCEFFASYSGVCYDESYCAEIEDLTLDEFVRSKFMRTEAEYPAKSNGLYFIFPFIIILAIVAFIVFSKVSNSRVSFKRKGSRKKKK